MTSSTKDDAPKGSGTDAIEDTRTRPEQSTAKSEDRKASESEQVPVDEPPPYSSLQRLPSYRTIDVRAQTVGEPVSVRTGESSSSQQQWHPASAERLRAIMGSPPPMDETGSWWERRRAKREAEAREMYTGHEARKVHMRRHESSNEWFWA